MYGRVCHTLVAVLWLISVPQLLAGQDGAAVSIEPLAGSQMSRPMMPGPLPAPHVVSKTRQPLNFSDVVHQAGTIFSGTVTGIHLQPASRSDTVQTVAITFHVEQAIRGVSPGQDLTISQWIGLWSGGQRYRIGERVLLFLYPRSKLGLTSAVAGPMGRFTIISKGSIPLSAQHLSAFRRDPVLGGKSRATLSDFALAVRRAGEEE
jgi:hypothetical protein